MEKASPAVQTFKGLKFISKGEAAKGWDAVSEHFDRFAYNGLLHRSKFGQCIGNKCLLLSFWFFCDCSWIIGH